MPDTEKKTISATQTPALWNASPYLTRWMLYRSFAEGDEIDKSDDARMNWGRKLQPLVLEQVAHDLVLEIRSNEGDTYIRRGLLGCTRDGDIICPDRGPGAVETKCVFDYGVWMRDWDGGKRVPRHYEIQLQQQMKVGTGDVPFAWGVIAAWVCGEMHYFEREPIIDLWSEMDREAERFFDDVKNKREPDPFGATVESELLGRVFQTVKGKVADFTGHARATELAYAVRMLKAANETRALADKEADGLKAKLLAIMGDAETGLFAHGITIKRTTSKIAAHQRKESIRTVLKPFVPDNLDEIEIAREGIDAALQEAVIVP